MLFAAVFLVVVVIVDDGQDVASRVLHFVGKDARVPFSHQWRVRDGGAVESIGFVEGSGDDCC